MQRAHSWTASCSGHKCSSRDVVGMRRNSKWRSGTRSSVGICDGSWELSHGPSVWVGNAKSFFYDFITTSVDNSSEFLYNVGIVMYILF